MSHDKLRQWLKLVPGAWPPNHYALIGLAAGAGSAEEIEGRILERLELLRRYQLPHPDEATEGMNLLAQALDTLTDPDERARYDRSLGVKAAAAVEPPPLPSDHLLKTLFPGVTLLPAEAEGEAPATGELLDLPEAVLLPEEDEPDDDPEFFDDEPPELPAAILLPSVPPPIARLATEEAKPSRPMSPRRALYADLARVRKVLRVWERARPYLTDPDRTFARRTDSLALMGCFAELRPLLPTVTDLVAGGNRPGGIVAALARQRLLYDTFRGLLPDQREALAKDFRSAHYRLAGYYDDLRDEVRRLTAKDWTRAVAWPLARYVGDHPELMLLPVAVVIFAVALARSV